MKSFSTSSRHKSKTITKKRPSKARSEAETDDLQEIVIRLNGIIERSNKIDEQLTAIEMSKLKPKNATRTQRKKAETFDLPSSPVLRTSPLSDKPQKPPSLRTSPKTPPSTHFDREHRDPTIGQVLEAINSLREEVHQIAENQEEMRKEIARLRRGSP